jgi:hypothetical protein
MQTFRVVTFTALAKKTPSSQMYDPARDDGRGIVRLSGEWGRKLNVGRGELVRVTSERCSRVYMLRMSASLDDDEIALGYDQRVELGIVGQGYEPERKRELEVRKAPWAWGTLRYLWQHIDPAIRFPFRISVALFALGVVLGAVASSAFERSLVSLLGGG